MLLAKNECCGCGACEAICQFGAISMRYDVEGFLYPHKDEKACRNCGACETHCPVLTNYKIKQASHNIACYAGYLSSGADLKKSASGGAAYSISKQFLQSGGTVFGVSYSEDFTKAIYKRVDSLYDLDALRGSKYIQSIKGDVYKKVEEELKNQRVLFIGLPCEVGALKAYLGSGYDNLYTCELICFGPTSDKIAKEYTSRLIRKYKSKIVEFSVRHKEKGWELPCIRAKFESGREFIKPFYDSDYGFAFQMYTRPSCYRCMYKGNHRVADITIGDFLGVNTYDKYWNHDGVSSIMVHTLRGKELIDNLNDFMLFETDYGKILDRNYCLEKSVALRTERDKFSRILKKSGLQRAVLFTKPIKLIATEIIRGVINTMHLEFILTMRRKIVQLATKSKPSDA